MDPKPKLGALNESVPPASLNTGVELKCLFRYKSFQKLTEKATPQGPPGPYIQNHQVRLRAFRKVTKPKSPSLMWCFSHPSMKVGTIRAITWWFSRNF